MAVTGPDVSSFQANVDMAAVAKAGHVLVGIKATEGTGFLDKTFAAHRTLARAANLTRFLYHFGRPSSVGGAADAVAEAHAFISAIGTLEPNEVAVLDIEDDKVAPGADIAPWALAFLAEVEKATGRRPMLYTYGPYAHEHLKDPKLAAYPLWLADYEPTATTPKPWKTYAMWQHTSSGACPGIVGRCDLNIFSGSIEDLKRLAAQPVTSTSTAKDKGMVIVGKGTPEEAFLAAYPDLLARKVRTEDKNIVPKAASPDDVGFGIYCEGTKCNYLAKDRNATLVAMLKGERIV